MDIDESRLMNVMSRAEAGGELVIGFLGGSITQGSLSSTPDTCYAALVYQWWVKAFPRATFHYVNAGIGGTDSLYGVARAWDDLLMYRPDVIAVDFSVNDKADTAHVESFEGLMRRLLSADCRPAVLLLCNARYDNGDTAEAVHRLIAEHYGLPVVSMKSGVYSKILAGEYITADLSPDGLHPNDRGHKLVTAEIVKYLESVQEKSREYLSEEADKIMLPEREQYERNMRGLDNMREPIHINPDCSFEGGHLSPEGEKEAAAIEARWEAQEAGLEAKARAEVQTKLADKYILPQPFTANAWENARRLTIANASPVLRGFRADAAEKMGHLDLFKNGWIGAHRGNEITFTLDNVFNIAVQYRKTVKLPACKAYCSIREGDGNGKEINCITLDGNFTETWGDCLYIETMLLHGGQGTYTVNIEVTDDGGEKECTPFYLMSLIVS